MMMSSSRNTSYISIRDDAGIRSLSQNERSFLRSGALASDSSKILRLDGRGPGEVRKIRIHLTRRHNGAECTVQWGETRVSAELSGSLQPPVSDDRPAEGIVSITVDTSPMASTAFGMMQPLTTNPGDSERPYFASTADETQKLLSNRILRCLERAILVGGALDTEALCVHSGAWVWKLSLAIRVLDHGGNLLDSSVLAAMAALRHYRKPQVDLPELGMPLLVSSDVREPTPLPLHHTPLSISFALIHADDVALSTSSTLTVASLVDSTEREELVQTGSISLAMNIHSEVCLLDFGGGCELQPSQLKKCWKLAETSIHQLCQMLESTLQEADEKAQQERLHRLQQLQDYPNLPPLPADPAPPVPFWFQDGDLQVDVSSPFADPSQEVQEAEGRVKDQEQEAYRLQALDFTRGHIAARVREDDTKKIPQEGTNTLLVAMLQAVQTNDVGSGEEGGLDANIVSRHEISSRSDAEHSSSPASRFQSAAKSPAIALPEPKQGEGAIPVHFDDEDEEELPTILQSEFDAIKPSSKPAKAAVLTDDDVDDLAMAIKNKKKKPKKSK